MTKTIKAIAEKEHNYKFSHNEEEPTRELNVYKRVSVVICTRCGMLKKQAIIRNQDEPER